MSGHLRKRPATGFNNLPTELKIMIFEYAATPDKSWGVPWSEIITGVKRERSTVQGSMTMLLYGPLWFGFSARTALLTTCRLARQMSLEAWLRDLIHPEQQAIKNPYWRTEFHWRTEFKEEFLKLLKKKLEETKGWQDKLG